MIWLLLYKLSRVLHTDPVETTFVVGLAALWLFALLLGAAMTLLSTSSRRHRD